MKQRVLCSVCSCFGVLAVTLVLAFYGADANYTVVETLPGFPGKLPFKLETGYIGVGDLDEIQLFYYFIESERSPSKDPLVFWLTGGPACSGFSAIAFEIGPIGFDYDNFDGVLPQILINEYSWTRVANIIFIDQPVGAGFSYSTTLESRNSSDTKAAADAYTFLRKWLVSHPQFLGNELYVGGDSYSGKIVPLVTTHILQGMETQLQPRMQLQGYLLGNPVSDNFIDVNSRIPYVHRVNLISDEYYEDAKTYCGGNYVDVDANNTLCNTTLTTIMDCLLQINMCQILEPQCAFAKPKTMEWDLKVQEAEIMEHLSNLETPLPPLYCRGYTYVLGYKYMNDDDVREALGVRPGTVGAWYRCPKSNPFYSQELDSIIDVQKNLSTTGLRALIYSGDHDISVPWIGTLSWIESLGIDVFDAWRPWYVDGQVAGYQVKFMNTHYRLTYVTVKGAGHTAPEYKHKETMEMVNRFFARYPI